MADDGSRPEGEELTELNVANRTLAIMDNLRFLRALNNECIDLIAIAPPFAASGRSPEGPGRPSAKRNTPRRRPWPSTATSSLRLRTRGSSLDVRVKDDSD